MKQSCSKKIPLVCLLALVLAVNGCGGGAGSAVPPDKFCEMKFELLGKAVADYRSTHGELPQTSLGPSGHSHSWRTLVAPNILAYADHPGTFTYRFGEPWNSAYNRDVFRKGWLAGQFTCPAESMLADYRFVSYVMLLRSGPKGSMRLPDDAVLIVESTGCGIEYGEPRDVDLESLFKDDSPFGVGKLNSLHPKIRAIRADGKVIDIPKHLSKDELRKLLMGTVVDDETR